QLLLFRGDSGRMNDALQVFIDVIQIARWVLVLFVELKQGNGSKLGIGQEGSTGGHVHLHKGRTIQEVQDADEIAAHAARIATLRTFPGSGSLLGDALRISE